MEADDQQSLYQIQTFQTIRQQLTADSQQPDRQWQQLWLSIQEDQVRERARGNSPEGRMLLQVEIVGIQASLQEVHQLIHTLEAWH